ncbi:hypothetical protein [Hymenobacter chitinivorans]|uniref:Uncharacterized protein n=1 Tax=Hymenobacter chitinivorans DSM 11115 TaxID=1121954 RepID=A0A2M9ASB1_9BACT|nr:hypothetical protein [Hymenobacter chitinivorans]PJJ48594.1 hypothetical protein CLV45_4303 [Hymenobacter chitinivorans DSM 11115]
MCKSFLAALLLSAALLSCESRQPAATTSAPTAPAESAAPAVPARRPGPAVADTAAPFVTLHSLTDSTHRPPLVSLGGQQYRVLTSAKTNPRRHLPVPSNPQDSTDVATGQTEAWALEGSYGYDVEYTVRLVAANGKSRFATTLHKADFAAAMSQGHVNESAAAAPDFYGYLPGFNALVFVVPFYLHDSDNGGEALLLLDAATGKVRHIGRQGWAFGAKDHITLTPDGRTLVTSYEIVHADGRHVSLARKDREAAGALLVDDNAVLAVYEGTAYLDADGGLTSREINGPNAYLLDLNGRETGRFNFHGTQAEMGYAFTHQYLAQTRSHYLFDAGNKVLLVLTRNNLLAHRPISLSQLRKFAAPRQPTEVRFHLTPSLGGHLTLYVDTLSSSAVRYSLVTPKYE